jgi:hypothetical protein
MRPSTHDPTSPCGLAHTGRVQSRGARRPGCSHRQSTPARCRSPRWRKFWATWTARARGRGPGGPMIRVRHAQPRRVRTVVRSRALCPGRRLGPARAMTEQGTPDPGWIKPACVLRKHGCGVRAALLPAPLRNHVAVQRDGGRRTDRRVPFERRAFCPGHRCLAPQHLQFWSPRQTPEQENLR